jgi:hypothetical protein
VVAVRRAGDPVSIPHDIENRGVATGIDQELNPQLSVAFPPRPQVRGMARVNLSRWRHGFKSRWDYQRKPPGQGTSPESIRSLNRDSNSGYPANIPHRIERSESAKGCARQGWNALAAQSSARPDYMSATGSSTRRSSDATRRSSCTPEPDRIQRSCSSFTVRSR